MHSEKEGSLGIRDAPAKTELMRQKFIKWSIELGVHGYPNIFRVHSWLLKWMWIVSLLAAVGGCCYLIQLSVREYLEYNVNTRIRTFIEMPMALPGIKICQNVILSQAGIDYALNYYRNKTGSTGLRNLAEAYRNYSMSFIELSTMFSKLSIDVPKESLGVELNKFMISCTLGTRNCTEYPYSYKFQDSTAGYCLTVNEGTRGANNKIVPESIYQANRAGSVDGLWAFFYLGSSRRMFLNTLSIANGVGLGVRVFNQSESPVTFSSDILASPGYCTLIRVTKTVKISMPEPYSRCRDLNSFSSDLFNKMKAKNITYKQSVCIEMCFHNVIMANCSCATEWLANIGTNLSLCRSSIQADCAYTTYRNNIDLLSSQCLDQCPLECEKVEYSYELSFNTFPSPNYVYYNLLNELKSRFPNLTDEDLSFENMKNSLVCLSISMKRLEFTVLDESPSKTTVQLISDVGGNLGLLLGWSLLNLIDMVEIVIEMIFIIFSRL